MIYQTIAHWNDEERSKAIAVLAKIAYCEDQGTSMPGEVFEALCRAKKNIATELVLFNKKGELFLVRRPSVAEAPYDPYAGLLHCPGATHKKDESTEESLERLKKREGLNFSSPILVKDDDRWPTDGLRARYHSRIFIAETMASQANPQGKFYKVMDIPADEVVKHHWEYVIPIALEACARLFR